MWISPQEAGVEEQVQNLVLWLKLAVEACGALVIACGVLLVAWRCLRQSLAGQKRDYNRLRLTFARFLALALELQLAADILSTAVAPSWDQIGKLGAIAVLRTALNYFLAREIRETEAGGRPVRV
ncbi:DUF1622 domain-containing protein [Chromobacterium violaceum]|uniref:DUF1622 domain-containing protein n=1 Tax=Chromobacterium violaceum TaxID=536 RepID=UPI001C8C8F7A|nr:DUF1622 domain-containing protein [Chromobacterium violaceum]MBX9266961.1 DUF1622 domain-containing protein [Chromobacterium violaceum]